MGKNQSVIPPTETSKCIKYEFVLDRFNSTTVHRITWAHSTGINRYRFPIQNFFLPYGKTISIDYDAWTPGFNTTDAYFKIDLTNEQ